MTPQTIQFMLGAHVVAVPVVTPDTNSRVAHLPQGESTHLWSGGVHRVGAAGKTFTQADARLDAPPAYVDMNEPRVAGAVDALEAAAVIKR